MLSKMLKACLLGMMLLVSVLGTELPPPVEGEYIVLLEKGERLPSHLRFFQDVADPSSFIMGEIVIGERFVAFGAKMSEKVVDIFRRRRGVRRVEPNSYLSIYATQENPKNWGLDRVDQRQLPLNQKYIYPDHAGEGVDVYIVDTGINIKHVEFASGNAVWGVTTPRDSDDLDLNGHGSHVCGSVVGAEVGIAKKAKCIAVKVMKDSGLGTVFDITRGLSWVADEHKKGNGTSRSIANMSLGSPIPNPIIDESVAALVEAGVIVIVAAGNSDRNACNTSPAGEPSMITIGASDSEDNRASFSNWGSCVDLFAPGVNITSAWFDSNTEYFVASGTSMASPHAAGLAALILQDAKLPFTQEDMRAALVSMATKDALSNVGTGSPNLLGYNNPPPSL